MRAREPQHPDRNAHILNLRALHAIQRSGVDDFGGGEAGAMAWGNWCREIAVAAMLADEGRVVALARVVGRGSSGVEVEAEIGEQLEARAA
jgi:hypothetical protein